jgi:hypothetical protein
LKVSNKRLDEARTLRDAALLLLDRSGSNTLLLGDRKWHKLRVLIVHGLSIQRSADEAEHLLDIWQGRKVFSVRWGAVDAINVVAFRPGDWKDVLGATAELRGNVVLSEPLEQISAAPISHSRTLLEAFPRSKLAN